MPKIIRCSVAALVFGLLIVAGIRSASAQATGADEKRCAGSDAQAAISACDRVLKQRRLSNNDRATAHAFRGQAHFRLGKLDQAISDFDEAIKLNPKNARAFNSRGLAYSKKDDYEHAIRDFDVAIKLSPKDASAYNNRGFAYAQKGHPDDAIRDFDVAIRLNPKYASAYNNRGFASAQKGALDVAIRDFDVAIRLDSKYADAYYGRGFAYNQKGDYDRAIRNFNTVIRLKPNDSVAYSDRGFAHAQKGDYDRAIRDYDEVIRLRPNKAIAYRNRGVAYAQKGDLDRAIRDYDEVIRLNPKVAVAFIDRGFAYQMKGDYDRAIRDYDQAIRVNPKIAVVFNNRGFAYQMKNDYDRAIRDYDEAIKLDPRFSRPYFHRGEAYLHKGDTQRARADLSRALELNPDASDVRAALAKLDSVAPETRVSKAEPPTPGTGSKPIVNASPTPPRVALVIGNGKYRFAPALPNPPNDARDVSAALRDLGFKVIEGYDLDSAGMRAKIAEFGAATLGATTALFFYAGHAVQVAGKNYLLPTDAKLARPSSLNVEAIAVNTILADMETEQRTNLVFLDACRDNPLAHSLARSFGNTQSSTVGEGLAQVNAGTGTLITFAASPNKLAPDGNGKHSPFTDALLKHISEPNVEIRAMIKRVRADVLKATDGKQTPWDHSSLRDEFYFKRGG